MNGKTRAPRGAGSIHQRPNGLWEGAVRVLTPNGGKKRVHVYGQTRAEVNRKLRSLTETSDKGIPRSEKSWTVREWIEQWLNQAVAVHSRPRTLERYRSVADRYIVPYLGTARLRTLSVTEVQSAIDAMQADGVGTRTIQQFRQVLSAALSRAERQELVHRNVARLVDLPQYAPKEITPWTLDQARTFLAAVRGHQWEIGYVLLLVYGMRRGEAVGLRWSDIDFEHSVFHVRQQLQRIGAKVVAGDVKTRAGRRTLPLLPPLEDLLRARAEDLGLDLDARLPSDALILTSKTGAPVEPGNFARTFLVVSEHAGLPRITVHHTRHTAATLLKSFGVQARDVQLILGHSNVSTTQQLYQHGYADEHRAALHDVADALIDAESGAPHEQERVDNSAFGRMVRPKSAEAPANDTADASDGSNENPPSTRGGDGGIRWRDQWGSNPRHPA
jgi:integrase